MFSHSNFRKMLTDSFLEYHKNGNQKIMETFEAELQKGIKQFICNRKTTKDVFQVGVAHLTLKGFENFENLLFSNLLSR